MKPPYAIGSVPNLSGHATAYRWRLSFPRIPECSWASLPSHNARIYKPRHVRVCVFSSKLFWTSSSLDVPAGVTVQYSTVQHRRGKREEGGEPVSKHQIRLGDGRWTGRRGVGRLNPRREDKIQGKNEDREGGKLKKSQKGGKFWKILARKRRRRGRAERRRLRQGKRRNRARAPGREIAVATHNVRTMAVDGTHGVGRALDVLSVYDRLGCDVIGLQETRRSGHSAFSQAGYLVYCSGECGGENGGKKGQGGVGLAVRNSITRAARPPAFISDRLLKVTLELRGRAKAVTFVVGYAPTETQNANNKHAFWTSLDRVVKEVPKHEQLFVLMDANARTGRREK